MALESTPASVASDGFFRLAFVPDGSDPLSVTVLDGATTKSLTYSLTPAGFNRTTTEELINDERLTLRQLLQKAGRVTHELEVQYVFGDAGDVAKAALVYGTKGTIVARYAIDNATDWAAAQVVDTIPIECGFQRKDAPTANGVWTITQRLVVVGQVGTDVELIA